MIIVPHQAKFDRAFPVVLGNREYQDQSALLLAMDSLIATSGMEEHLIQHFLEVASDSKVKSVSGTDKDPRLTAKEKQAAQARALFALRAAVLRKYLRLPLRRFALALAHSDLYKWFCRINRFSDPRIPGKSAIHDFENMIPVKVLHELDSLLLQSVQKDSCESLIEPIDFGQCYMDSTCLEANIHFPVDWLLMRDATRTMMLAVERIRELGLKNRMPGEPSTVISAMNQLCIEMTHVGRQKDCKYKRKAILRRMKKHLKGTAKHAMAHFALLDENWEQTDLSRPEVERILRQISGVNSQLAAVIKQAHERMIGERQVANKDKILSLYDADVHVIVRRKAGAQVEFGNTLLVAEQADGLIVDWKLFQEQAPGDAQLLKESHQRIVDHIGVPVTLIGGDRGFDSQQNRSHLEKHEIFNALCPRDPKVLRGRLEEDLFIQSQKRRSQTEGRIGILKHCFLGSPMLQKGFAHREQHLGWSILSHNLWLLGRLKIAQEQKLQQDAA